MSKSTYRFIDLLILTIISAILEFINIIAFKHFPLEGFSASFIIVLGAIAIYRWGPIGVFVPVISGISSVAATQRFSNINFVLSSTVGYSLMVFAALLFRKKDKRAMSKDLGMLILYFIFAFVLAEIGRALCYIGSANIGDALFTIFVLDLFNLVINLVVFIIASKVKNFVYDMNDYLVDINTKSKEPKSATMREAQEDYLALESLAESNQVSECALLDGGMLTEDDLIELQRNYNKFTGTPGKFDNPQIIKDEKEKKEDSHDTSK